MYEKEYKAAGLRTSGHLICDKSVIYFRLSFILGENLFSRIISAVSVAWGGKMVLFLEA